MNRTQAAGPVGNVLTNQQMDRPLDFIFGDGLDGLDWKIMFPIGTKREALISVLHEALGEADAPANNNGKQPSLSRN